MSYQKKGRRSHAHPFFFWYDNGSDTREFSHNAGHLLSSKSKLNQILVDSNAGNEFAMIKKDFEDKLEKVNYNWTRISFYEFYNDFEGKNLQYVFYSMKDWIS